MINTQDITPAFAVGEAVRIRGTYEVGSVNSRILDIDTSQMLYSIMYSGKISQIILEACLESAEKKA